MEAMFGPDENGEGLFCFRRYIKLSLTYLDTYPLTYSPGTHTGPTTDETDTKTRICTKNKWRKLKPGH